jgi:hypothetical protein
MSRLRRAAIAVLIALVVGASVADDVLAQGEPAPAPPPFRSDYPFGVTSCLHSASAACRRKPRSPAPLRFNSDSVRVQGDPAAFRIEAHQTTIANVLFALATAFNIRYHASIALDQVLNGTYSGSLRYVISRVLDGYNYVIEYENSKLNVIILGKVGEQAVAAPPSDVGIRRGRCACPVEWPPSSATRLSHQNRCACKP